MTKLHEIQIYALSENKLSKRYERFKDSFGENSPPIDEETFKRCIEHETHPQRCWNHNHVVESIDILLDKQDIVFEIYLPYPEVKRYDWRRSRKIYVRNIMANGTHFYLKSEMSNTDIQSQLSDMLNFIVKDHIPKNGIIPCEIRNTPTHKYSIEKEDVLAYMAKSDHEKRKEIPVGIFNAKKVNNPRRTESPDSDCGGYFDDTNYKLRGKERARFVRMLEDLLSAVPDTLTADEVAEVTGYSRTTILRYVRKKYIYAVTIMGKYYISKKSIINYLATDRAFKNTQKSEWHKNIILKFQAKNNQVISS